MQPWRASSVLKLAGLAAVAVLALASCSLAPSSPTFTLRVAPVSNPDVAQNARGVFLVSVVEADAPSGHPVYLEATASAGLATLSAAEIRPGDVAELSLTAVGVPVETVVQITVTAHRGHEVDVAVAEATVTESVQAPDDRLVSGIEVRDAFLPWLIAEHPELGITTETTWTATPFRPHILVVSFYRFESPEWELLVWWHVMIPPYDWARMALRRRFSETAPSFAAEIASRSAGSTPQAMTPPDEFHR